MEADNGENEIMHRVLGIFTTYLLTSFQQSVILLKHVLSALRAFIQKVSKFSRKAIIIVQYLTVCTQVMFSIYSCYYYCNN